MFALYTQYMLLSCSVRGLFSVGAPGGLLVYFRHASLFLPKHCVLEVHFSFVLACQSLIDLGLEPLHNCQSRTVKVKINAVLDPFWCPICVCVCVCSLCATFNEMLGIHSCFKMSFLCNGL